MRFFNDDFIAPNTPVMMEMNILSRVLRPVGRIAWSAPIPHSDRYAMGVEFVEFENEEKRYLQDYIDMHSGRL